MVDHNGWRSGCLIKPNGEVHLSDSKLLKVPEIAQSIDENLMGEYVIGWLEVTLHKTNEGLYQDHSIRIYWEHSSKCMFCKYRSSEHRKGADEAENQTMETSKINID